MEASMKVYDFERKLLLLIKETPRFDITQASIAAQFGLPTKDAASLLLECEANGLLSSNITNDGIYFSLKARNSLNEAKIYRSIWSRFGRWFSAWWGLWLMLSAAAALTYGIAFFVENSNKNDHERKLIEIKEETISFEQKQKAWTESKLKLLDLYKDHDALREKVRSCAFDKFTVSPTPDKAGNILVGTKDLLLKTLDNCLLGDALNLETEAKKLLQSKTQPSSTPSSLPSF